jgi:zinc carboxypeptidase
MRRIAFAPALLAALAMVAQAGATPSPGKGDWVTPAEASAFHSTPDYATTVGYLKRLVAATPDRLQLMPFGTTPQGRPMEVVVASNVPGITPAMARERHLPVLLVQAGIHPGEIEGKDAGLMLLRDLALGHKFAGVLDHVVLVYIPVFSVDGHEQSSPYNRINQNGPDAMGFRGQSQYLNLNRDYIKADAPEMLAWLKLWNTWLPDFLVDVHTTDGADYQYDLTWYTEDPHKLDPGVDAWQRATLARVMPAFDRMGHLNSRYLEFKDGRDITKGIENFGSGPRFSTGYAALQNRPALLIETHMLKSYEVRVRATYDLIAQLLRDIAAHPGELTAATARADAATVARASDSAASVPLTFKPDPATTTMAFKGYAFSQTKSDVSGDTWVQYDPTKKKTYRIEDQDGLLPDLRTTPPAAYAIPAQWTDVIAKLDAHGISYRRLAAPLAVDAEGYQLDNPVWASKPFEGRVMLQSFAQAVVKRHVTLPAGSVIVPMDQRAANVAIELLEPQAPDSLLRWGFFNATFEPKEYGEPRVLEALARQMMAKDPALKAEFEKKLSQDKTFAASARVRLFFFFERSPWYAVQGVGAYPVLRLQQEPALPSTL